MRSRAPFLFLLFVASAGCREILGIEERPVTGDAGGSGGGGGTTGGSGGTLAEGGTGGGAGTASQAGAAGTAGGCTTGTTRCEAVTTSPIGMLSYCVNGTWTAPATCAPGLPCASATACQQITRVALGSSHSCATLGDGSVRCWGDDQQGQCGVPGSADVTKPTPVASVDGAAGVALGEQTSCAIAPDKTVWCWGGSNGVGALGNGTTDSKSTAVQVIDANKSPLGSVVSLSLGARHACAAQENGTVLCWGDNSAGQLGQPIDTVPFSTVAIAQPDASAVAVASGAAFTCALASSGDVRCWGDGSLGQLGGADSSVTPVQLALDGKATQIAAGARHACAILENKAVTCWGDDAAGQTGPGAAGAGGAGGSGGAAGSSGIGGGSGQSGSGGQGGATPAIVSLMGGATSLALGDAHSCAVVAGSAWCWGENRYGQTGWAVNQAHAKPRQVNGVQGASGIAAGRAHTCAWGTNHPLWCWGEYLHGQLGNGDDFDTAAPHPIPIPGTQVGIALGGSHACALDDAHGVRCWGWNAVGQLGTGTTVDQQKPVLTAPPITDAASISTGLLSTCAFGTDSSLSCWGYTPFNTFAFSPTKVTLTGAPAKAIALGDEHACVLRATGDVSCAGRNDAGQSGAPDLKDVLSFDAIVLTTASAVAVGARHSCAITGGKVRCWGDNGFGQLGVATPAFSEAPLDVPLPGSAVALALGANHTCTQLDSGKVYCWGDNGHGQLGHGAPGLPTSKPTLVVGVQAKMVAAGAFHTCAIMAGIADGSLRCWGAGDDGQLGQGKGDRSDKGVPASVMLDGPASAVALGAAHSCAVLTTGSVSCWGYGGKGQLGLGQIGFSFETTNVIWQ